jgi:pyroglutamyl-peptidase
LTILLTGFNTFKGVRVNPSEQVVRALTGWHGGAGRVNLVAAVLPTEYAAATRKLRRLIQQKRPDAVLCLGVAPRRDTISIERIALNLDDDATPDNARTVRRGTGIVRGGPDIYWSTLPLKTLANALRRRRIQVSISNHAGSFLCNHAFYVARHETAQFHRTVPCGFIHLPGCSRSSRHSPPIERMIHAVRCCLEVLSKHA